MGNPARHWLWGNALDERLARILEGIGNGELAGVAAGALGVPSAVIVGKPVMTELTTPHFDRKTIGIVRVSGLARAEARDMPWSVVAKVSDFSLAQNEGIVTHSEEETTFYERQPFAGDALPFRPARCHGISRPSPALRVLWLEDLTGAKGTPFDVPTLKTIVRHLGQWNGYHAERQTVLDIPVGRDAFVVRWRGTGLRERLADIPECASTPSWRAAFDGLSPEIVIELFHLADRLFERVAAMPHALAFGDLAAGNVFLNGNETVAIDWASLSMDPFAVDGGCLCGGPLTWAGSAEIAGAEPELFEAYLDGLRDAGWKGNRDEVRRAYLCLYSMYMLYVGLMPVYTTQLGKPFSREFMEARYQAKLEAIPAAVAGVIQRFPVIIEEVKRLLA